MAERLQFETALGGYDGQLTPLRRLIRLDALAVLRDWDKEKVVNAPDRRKGHEKRTSK